MSEQIEIKDVDVKINETISYNPGKAVNCTIVENASDDEKPTFSLVDENPADSMNIRG